MSMRGIRIAAVVLGIALLAILIYESGPSTIVSDLRLIGCGMIAILALEFVVDGFNTLGWWFTFPPGQRGGQFRRLFLVRLAGTALNQTVPAASMGGEPAKVYLLQPHFPPSTAIASVIVSRFTFSAAKAVFIAVGMMITASLIKLPYAVSIALAVGFLATLSGVMLFLILQLRGLSAASARILARLRVPDRWTSSVSRISPGVDSEIIDFYRSRAGDFARAMVSHQLAFLCGVIQVYLLLGWMGLPADLRTSLAIESFSMLMGFVTFVVPGSLGIQEGAAALIFTALRLPIAAGVTLAIAFRLTSIFGAGTGLIAMAALQARRVRTETTPAESGS